MTSIHVLVPEQYQREQKLLSVSTAQISIDRTEITFEWSGESLRAYIPSVLYTVYRFLRYGRVTDLETIYLLSAPRRIDMNGTLNHPEVTSWHDVTSGHYTTTFTTGCKDLRLYVNTWNHLMSPLPLPDLVYVELTGFKQNTETRASLERKALIRWPWKQTVSISATKAPYIDARLLVPR